MEERNYTQTKKQEEIANENTATRMTSRRRKRAQKRKKMRTSQGRTRKPKAREKGPLGRPMTFFTQGHHLEERKQTQTEK